MRAWHVEAPGPVTGHPLRLHPDDDVPRPGPGELLLRVLACGVCRTDLHVTEGDLPPHEPGVTPGHEVVGEVTAVGEGEGATPTRPGTFGAYVVTDDVDAVYQRAKAAGAEIIAEPHDTDYGSHDFAARDPEGNRWSFGTYRGEPRKG